MATAIDFAAMMAEEKRKMLSKAADERDAQKSHAEPDLESNRLPWQVCADRNLRLTPGRRPKLDLASYEAAGDALKVCKRSHKQADLKAGKHASTENISSL